ncbi:dehydrase and lipid transport-domain-containing protein [Microdochium trichocladiopsis]|uniref:Dehydrase and lipid transport-domain-containing protein n=1 Tax=Microdochium trichocladiopsis TaxID=1682393 RepID=A0A9P8Y8U7_9PEZI|nr:dehydrase and lipid transport-domain-containing protein [Microdochium trichocladiopsis]KAH7033304.1 dehydrase and lipid transport-domain-containing protein [Microdochium trichocladiopsis]
MSIRSPLRIIPTRLHGTITTTAATRTATRHTRRNFFSSPPPQTLTAERTLPYPAARVYDLIADVDSYTQFLPYCKVARVTAWTDPRPYPNSSSSTTDKNNDGTATATATANTTTASGSLDPTLAAQHRRWPTRADLTAGWGGFEETYTSRLFCIPGRYVEAISGDARTEIPASLLREHGLVDPGPLPDSRNNSSSSAQNSSNAGVFKSLVTRWTVTPDEARTKRDMYQHEWTNVRLDIRFAFANPLYAAVSSAVADKVAPIMIDAFDKRARAILGHPSRK